MNSRSLLVPGGTFLLAILLSLAISPAPRVSARAVQEMTGGDGCTTQLDIPEKPTWLPRGNEGGDEKAMGNAIRARVKWEPTSGADAGKKRKFEFRLSGPPALKGICDNKGKESFPDFTLEASDNSDWEIEDGIPEYGGVQNLSAVTKQEYPHGVWVDILIRSYDFGAWTRVFARAQGCPEVSDRIPLDSDEDTLPDAWEKGKFYFDDVGHLREYNIASPTSEGEELDADSDRDGGFVPGRIVVNRPFVKPAKVHDELGDGYNAFEEYRGVFVKKKFHRMNELVNDGGPEVPGAYRGPALKNVFSYETDIYIVDSSGVLYQHGVAFHRIDEDEMSAEHANGKPVAGFVDFNSEGQSQRAIYINDGNLGTSFGDSGGFSVNDEPDQILINVNAINTEVFNVVLVSTGKGPTQDELVDFTVAHEIGHKFSLRHPEGVLTLAEPPRRYDEGVYWIPQATAPSVIHHWTLGEEVRENGVLALRILSRVPPSFGGPRATRIVGEGPNAPVVDHNLRHQAEVRENAFQNAIPAGPIPFQLHTGSLMDWNAEYQRLTPPLPAAERRKVKVK